MFKRRGAPVSNGVNRTPTLRGLGWLAWAWTTLSWADPGFLQIKDGYFWDPAAGDYFVPRGVAYQIWNPPVGANQSLAQVDYDLVEFKKMNANSVRAEMTWGQIEIAPGVYDWTKPDHLVQKAEELGLRLFVIIGYQYPPAWLPTNWHGINSLGLRADVVQCLANSAPSNAFACLPPRTAADLRANTNLSASALAQVANSLVAGAKVGGVSNILQALEAALPPDQLTVVWRYLVSDVINYEDPAARAVYQQHIAAVTARYRNSPAIGAWILGNEYAYFDLWEDPALYPVHRFLGYDLLSQQSFQNYLKAIYQTNLAALNANWQTNYAAFEAVTMPLEYPVDRHFPGYQDLLQWRKQSIADFVALGAAAAAQADPNHLRTYSMVGGLFNGRDANYTCEDAKAIVARCRAAAAPLDFWSINNYAWASLGSEMRSASFGIGKYQAESGLPVMISETGHSSTEDLFDYDSATGRSYAGSRQAKALPSTMWESLLSGAIGVHFFNWNDRSQFTQGYFYRERGFGIVQEDRLPKPLVYSNMVAMFRQMDNIRLDHLLGGSTNPPADVQYLWSTNADMVWPRANQENAMIWGALKRLGFQLGILDDRAFERGDFTNAPALLLSRCYQMDPVHLQRVADAVIPAGVHVHAEADLPGQYDTYDRANLAWTNLMQTIFGIDVSAARPGLDLIVTNDCYSPIHLLGTASLGPITTAYAADLTTWKLWQNVRPISARAVLADYGFAAGTTPGVDCAYSDVTHYSALLVNSTGAGRGKTAVNPFALGDTYNWSGTAAAQWDTRYALLHAIYRDHFGLVPAVSLSGTGSAYVLATYRLCQDGSVLVALLNEHTNTAFLTVSAPSLFTGRKVEDVSFGGVLSQNSNGRLTYVLHGDDCAVLYAYGTSGTQDASRVNANPNKVWFTDTPSSVWPTGQPWNVSIGFDAVATNLTLGLMLEQVTPRHQLYATAPTAPATGHGTNTLALSIPDADANNPDYLSSPAGGAYVLHAVLEQAGTTVSEAVLPVRLLLGVHPTAPWPQPLVAGRTYQIPLAWEELPSYLPGDPTPLDRAALWDSLSLDLEHYRVQLELSAGGQVVGQDSILTRVGTGQHVFSITVPSGAVGPFTWSASLQTATNVVSHNVEESFEGYTRGAVWPDNLGTNFFLPWSSFSYTYPPNPNFWQNEGVQLDGSDGSQSAFFVVTNIPSLTIATFGLTYVFPAGDWALPADHSQWTNYVFSYDFKESHGYACSVEMQVKNDDPDEVGKWLQSTNLYGGSGSNQWVTVRASLDQFLRPPGLSGVFDPTKVHELAVNVRVLTPGVQYVASIDHIQFLGPEVDQGGGVQVASYTSANDSLGWLSILGDPTGVTLSWSVASVLQSAPAVSGPWTDLTGATSPHHLGATLTNQFFRLRQP